MPRHEAYGPRRNCEYRLLQACFRRWLFAVMIATCTGKLHRKHTSSRERVIAHDNNPPSPTSVTKRTPRIGQGSPSFQALLIRSRRMIMTGGLISQRNGSNASQTNSLCIRSSTFGVLLPTVATCEQEVLWESLLEHGFLAASLWRGVDSD